MSLGGEPKGSAVAAALPFGAPLSARFLQPVGLRFTAQPCGPVTPVIGLFSRARVPGRASRSRRECVSDANLTLSACAADRGLMRVLVVCLAAVLFLAAILFGGSVVVHGRAVPSAVAGIHVAVIHVTVSLREGQLNESSQRLKPWRRFLGSSRDVSSVLGGFEPDAMRTAPSIASSDRPSRCICSIIRRRW